MRGISSRRMRLGNIDELNVLSSNATVFHARDWLESHVAVLKVGGLLEIWVRGGKVGDLVLFWI